jgi:membrane protein YqaA with SNARE-associated domain
MVRAFAASLGAIAMATVLLDGVFSGATAGDCIVSAIRALIVLALLGGVAGAIVDYLIRQDLEQQYRRRLDWFRKETEAIVDGKAAAPRQPAQDA